MKDALVVQGYVSHVHSTNNEYIGYIGRFFYLYGLNPQDSDRRSL